jgi:hypothetical protein
MASKNFPGPNINRIIEKDPQIVKINLDAMDWGSRMSIFTHMSGNAAAPNGGKDSQPASPNAPEIGISHVPSKS